MSQEKSESVNDPNEAAADDVLEMLEIEPSSAGPALQAALLDHPNADEDTVVAIVRKRRGLPPLDPGSRTSGTG
jgi:hypothetical protein